MRRRRNPSDGDPYNSARGTRKDPWRHEPVKKDRRPAPEVFVIDRRGKKVVVQRVKNPIDIMTALNAAGDLAMIREFSDEKRAGAFNKPRRKNPYGAGKCPPHLKKFRFKKVK